ncbi:MAG: O-antigen ligase family protein [Anaerolineae bacterium]|nr:O-antigen ligase family protein [Anaerolineae bacterium]
MDNLFDLSHIIAPHTLARLRAFVLTADRRRVNRAIVGLGVVVALVVGALFAFLTPIVGVAVIVAGLAGLLMLRDIRWGLFALLAIVFLLPFASLPFKIGFTPTFLDLAFGALYGVWAMRLITHRQRDLILTPVGLPVLIFIVLAVFSFVLGLKHSSPSSNALRTFAEVLMGFALFFLIVNNVRDEVVLRQVTAMTILAGAAEAATGIVFYIIPKTWTVRLLNPLGRFGYPVGMGMLRYIADDPDRPMRAIGTSVDPNILGAVLTIVIAIAAAQLFAKRPVLPRWILAGGLGMMGICVFLTYSRTAMLVVAVALVVVALVKYRRLLVIMAVAGLLLLLLPQTQAYIAHSIQGLGILAIFRSSGATPDLSTEMRMGEYADVFKLIRRYPWLGVGFVGTPDIDLYLGVASVYFTLAAEMGIVGLFAFLLAMAAFLVVVWRAWRALPADSPFAPFLLGYGAAVIGSLVGGVLDHTLLTFPHAVALLWLVLGMGTVAARLSADR